MNIKYFIKKGIIHTNNLIDKFTLNILFRPKFIVAPDNRCILVDLSLVGDVLVTLPYYHKLSRNLSKKWEFLVISNPLTSPIFKSIGLDVVTVNIHKFRYVPSYRMKLLRKIGKAKYVVITHPNRTEQMEELALKLYGENKVAYEGEVIYEKFKKTRNLKKFSLIIENPFIRRTVHISEHLRVIFSSLVNPLDTIDLNFNFKKEDYISLFSMLKRSFKDIDGLSYTDSKSKNYVVIVTDASANYRKYLQDRWQTIISYLPKNTNILQIGLSGYDLQHPNFIDLRGKTSLREAMSLVMNASLVIGNETGLTHLAYLSGVPTVCILGGGHFGRFLPWPKFDDVVKCVYKPMDCFQCGWRCKYVNLEKGEIPPCISQISPENVLKAIEELNTKYKIF